MRVLSGTVFLFFLCSSALCQVNFTSSNLPIIVIDTQGQSIGDEPKITADMGIIDNGPGQRNNMTDPFNNYNGKIGIEIRGSSSAQFPKKPFAIELRDASGNGISAPILGMPAEEDWSLIATYNDKSLMRDALAYKLARDLGSYAPRTRFCELVFKVHMIIGGIPTVIDDYQGIYMIAEKIKRDKNRVDISKLEPSETTGDDVTGGYIIKIDKSSGDSGEGFGSQVPPNNRGGSQQIYFQYEYPKYNEIVPAQKEYIQSFIRNFETVLKSSTYADPVNGYRKYINVDSFVDYLIINELSKNVDGYRLSTFMYKDKDSDGGKLVMGPVWDYNLAFGNANYCEGAPSAGWMYNFNSVCGGDWWLIPFWWSRLLNDISFRQQLAVRWQDLRETKLSNTAVNTYIDSMASVLKAEATYRNFVKWPVLGQYVWPNEFVGATYQSEVDWMKQWIKNRITWLDAHMPVPQVITANEPESNDAIFSIQAYPNPFQSDIQFQYSLRKPGTVTIELFDLVGHRIGSIERVHNTPGDFQTTLDQSKMADGIYYFKATSSVSPSAIVQRVFKQR